MSALGTLTARHLRPHARHPLDAGRDRSGPTHHLRPHARQLPATPPAVTGDFAHYPVRLNGRACDFVSGASEKATWPWTAEAQPQIDANGKRYYHAHAIALQWTVGAGARSITAHVWHSHPSGATPRLRIPARDDLGLAEQIIDAGAETDTEHTLTATFTAPTQATITVFLEMLNPLPGYFTSWGDILAT